MKFTTVCTTISSDAKISLTCLRCKRTVSKEKHAFMLGFWFPERPFEPKGTDRTYMYALCSRCEKKIIDKKTGKPKKAWVVWFEDEIKAILTVERPQRIKILKMLKH